MPPVVAAAAAVKTAFLASGAFTLFTGKFLLSAALTVGSALLSRALAPDVPDFAGVDAGNAGFKDGGERLVTRQAIPPQRMILGRALVGGPLFFLENRAPYLYFGILLAGHEIDAVEDVRIGTTQVFLDINGNATSTPFRDGGAVYLQVSVREGTANQTIDPILSQDFAELPANYRQRGIATAVCKMDYGADRDAHEALWGTQLPAPKFFVRGIKAYDPRNTSHDRDDPATWTWTDNAALLQAFWMTHKKGLNYSWDQIGIPALIKAADICDEQVTLKNGGTEKRYTINGVIILDGQEGDVLERLLTASAGKVVWRDGQYHIIAGAYEAPQVPTLNEDMARGSIQVTHETPRDDLINTVRTVITPPEVEYRTAAGPTVQIASYLAADGQERAAQLQLPFTNSHTMAQRLGKIAIEQSRRGRTVTRRHSVRALPIAAGDTVNLHYPTLPFVNGTYEAVEVRLEDDLTEPVIQLRQTDAAIWAWDPLTDERDFVIAPTDLEAA